MRHPCPGERNGGRQSRTKHSAHNHTKSRLPLSPAYIPPSPTGMTDYTKPGNAQVPLARHGARRDRREAQKRQPRSLLDHTPAPAKSKKLVAADKELLPKAWRSRPSAWTRA
eukprot:14432060-Alexandrium_andersonii.AAC.1